MKTILTTLIIGMLALTACGKDKKPAATEPTTAEPAKPEPTEPAKEGAAAPAADTKAPEKSGW